MKLLLVAALATMMALPAMANRSRDKEPGKERGRQATEKSREVREKVKAKGSQTHAESVTSTKNQVAESVLTSLFSITSQTGYNFKSLNEGKLPDGIEVITSALRQRAVKESIDANMVQNSQTIAKNFVESLELVTRDFPKEQAEKIYELADNILLASAKAYSQKSSADVKADVALVMTMVAQAKMFEVAKEAPPSYMNMVNNLLTLRVDGALKAGEVRKQMGEDLYSKALKSCLNAA